MTAPGWPLLPGQLLLDSSGLPVTPYPGQELSSQEMVLWPWHLPKAFPVPPNARWGALSHRSWGSVTWSGGGGLWIWAYLTLSFSLVTFWLYGFEHTV
jgi:hypothetical protein